MWKYSLPIKRNACYVEATEMNMRFFIDTLIKVCGWGLSASVSTKDHLNPPLWDTSELKYNPERALI